MVGILAVQGAFAEHAAMLERMSVPYKLIRSVSDMDKFDRLILPGGESTAQRKLLRELELYSPLKSLIEKGVPTFGSCAGLILLSEIISGGDETVFGTLPVKVCRNAYGRQLISFSAVGNVGNIADFPLRFIRAPYIESVLSDDVEVLNITYGRITAVRYKNQCCMINCTALKCSD